MKISGISCLSCGGKNLIDLGIIPEEKKFGRKEFNNFLDNKSLIRCRHCHLYFKYPVFDRSHLDELYKRADKNSWQYTLSYRKDWLKAAAWLEKYNTKGTIIDVGCWDGAFLNYLKEHWKCLGIEINPSAAEKAAQRGIKIISDNIYEADHITAQAEVVTAFDMIEHTAYPLEFLTTLCRLSKEKGALIISSGNTEALSWRINQNRYYYCASPEHISFINKKWCRFASERLNLKIMEYYEYSHSKSTSVMRRIEDAAKNFSYLLFPRIFIELRKTRIKKIEELDENASYDHPPYWHTSKNHFIALFQKK